VVWLRKVGKCFLTFAYCICTCLRTSLCRKRTNFLFVRKHGLILVILLILLPCPTTSMDPLQWIPIFERKFQCLVKEANNVFFPSTMLLARLYERRRNNLHNVDSVNVICRWRYCLVVSSMAANSGWLELESDPGFYLFSLC